jgi:protein ImuB
MQAWVPVCAEQVQAAGASAQWPVARAAERAAEPSAPYNVALPCWLLGEPQPLHVLHNRPHYQGALRLLAGPHRVEAGWWDVTASASTGSAPGTMVRDYFVAASPRAGLLWVFRSRLPQAPPGAGWAEVAGDGWFLHGIYG